LNDSPSARRRGIAFLRVLLALGPAVAVVTVSVALTGSTGADPAGSPVSATRPMPTSAPATSAIAVSAPPQGLAAAAVAAAVAAAEAASGAVGFAPGPAAAAPVGATIAVLDRRTSEVAVGQGGTAGVLSASLSKLVLAVDMVDRRRTEGLPITDVDIDLLRRALGPSDDAAMSALWSRFDGPGAAPRISARLGLTGVASPRDPSQWGEMVVTASDLLHVWKHVLDELPGADQELLIGAMAAAPARATDGFDQAFGLLAPDLPVEVGAAKQGWMCCIRGQNHLHSVGVVGPEDRFVLAVLTTMPTAATARELVDRMVAAASGALSPPSAG
jgi:hypothetical protein